MEEEDGLGALGGAAMVAAREKKRDEYKSKKHESTTRDTYDGYVLRWLDYMVETKPDAIVPRVRDGLAAIPIPNPNSRRAVKARKEFVSQCIKAVRKDRLDETGMLVFDQIKEDDVVLWMTGFRGRNDSTPHTSSFGSAQSALADLWKRHGLTLPDTFYAGIKDIQQGAAKTRAEEKVQGKVPMEEGKAAIPGHMYLELISVLLKSTNDTFAWVFSVMAWNLMCRVSNVGNIRGAHLKWDGDALLIHLVKHKADQEGTRTDPKHCYANPFNPTACIVTALGVYFAILGYPRAVTELVFDGNRQQDRFIEALRRALEASPDLLAKLNELGITVEDIASHSFRKGSRSYCQGGTTASPSSPSLLLRGGWAFEGMDGKYVRYEAAADQYIGRLVAMLDIHSPDFAALFPHFDVVDGLVLAAVQRCFPGAPEAMNGVLVPCLASLVYHCNWFRNNLPNDHLLFQTIPFTQGILQNLSGRVALSWPDDKISPTGIPPFVSTNARLQKVEQALQDLPGRVRAEMAAEFEARAFDSGTITRTVMEDMLAGTFARFAASLNPPPADTHPTANEANDPDFHMWSVNGVLRRVPEEFTFSTKLSSQSLFHLYCRGDLEAHIGPYRKLESVDFVDRKQKKRLSDVRTLMGAVEGSLKKRGLWKDRPTIEEVNEMWEEGQETISVDPMTGNGRKRRIHQMSWTSQLKLFRKKQHVASEDDDDE